MTLRLVIKRFIYATLATAWATPALAGGIYAQIVVPFNSARTFDDSYEKSEHTLVLEFQKTAPGELAPFEQYDERLIKRVIIKDLGPAGTSVKLVLRDRNVRAIVSSFTEPFRVTVDLFDADYAEERDPETGMPRVTPLGKGGERHADTGEDNRSLGSARLMQSDVEGQEQPADDSSSANDDSKRQLLQPMPELFSNPQEMTTALKSVADGVGKSWREFPPYIYRLQTAAYEEGVKKKAPSAAEAMTSTEAMASYASKMFDFGHEAKAMVAYQQVLHKDPSLFDRDALHLWKFAETHLGAGNMTLARGYYDALVEKHPESPLAAFGRLRILDISAIRLIKQARTEEFPSLAEKLADIKVRNAGELVALIALRRAYWSKEAASGDAKALPSISPQAAQELAGAYGQVESSRTAFLTASLLLNDMVRSDTPWQRATASFAEAYFKRFSGNASEPYRTNLRTALFLKLNANLQAKVTDGKLVEAIDDYEALPASMRSIKNSPKTAWALAEAYRKLGQPEKSADLYAEAAKTIGDGPDRFKSQFWLSVTAGNLSAQLKQSRGNQEKAARYGTLSREADRNAGASWQRLKEDERQTLTVAMKTPFEKTVSDAPRLRTGPKIVLGAWTSALSTKTDAVSGDAKDDWTQSFSPSGSTVILLTDLGKRFAELGMADERRQAINLLKNMKPKDFADDTAAKALWSKQLVNLAEDYRKANQYLDAGRLFSLVGAESENWDGRAESLYKGGLLLYRAGRRAEALESFQAAASDGNNLFYANLAKERLAQLK